MRKQTKFVSTKTAVSKSLLDKIILGWTVRELRAVMVWGWLFGMIATLLLAYSLERAPKTLSRPVSQTIPRVVEVEAAEPKCDDPISYIRCAGEKLGVPNEDIRTMIRISRCESSYNPRAKNPRSSASGLFQIIAGTWYSNDCVGDKWNFKDSTDCAYKIYQKRGFQPWNASKSCWRESL